MNLKCIVFGLILLVAGIAFFIGMGTNWIKAWREMPKEEKDKIRMNELSKNVGCVFFTAGTILLVAGFHAAFLNAAFVWCIIAWFVLTGIDVVYITRSKRYKDNLPVSCKR